MKSNPELPIKGIAAEYWGATEYADVNFCHRPVWLAATVTDCGPRSPPGHQTRSRSVTGRERVSDPERGRGLPGRFDPGGPANPAVGLFLLIAYNDHRHTADLRFVRNCLRIRDHEGAPYQSRFAPVVVASLLVPVRCRHAPVTAAPYARRRRPRIQYVSDTGGAAGAGGVAGPRGSR